MLAIIKNYIIASERMMQMKTRSVFLGVLMSAGIFSILPGTASAAAGKQMLHGYLIANMMKRTELVGVLPDTTVMDLQIGLSLRDEAGLDSLIHEIYNPASPSFHQYLKQGQVTEMFGPTKEDYQSVVDFMQAQGFKVTGTYPNRVVVDVRGAAADVERTFHVTMNIYRDLSKGRTFYAPDAEATIEGRMSR